MATRVLLQSAISTGAGSSTKRATDTISPINVNSFQAIGKTSTGVGAATVLIQVSNNGSDWMTLGTIGLTLGTSSTTDGFTATSAWSYIRANLTSVSGTDATVTVYSAE